MGRGDMSKWVWALILLTIVSAALYMTLGAKGSWSFVLSFRAGKLAGLTIFAVAISTSTLLFHTITNNRILTPSLIGFDQLYIMILSLIVFFAGAQSYLSMSNVVLFIINVAIMTSAAMALFAVFFIGRADLMRMILTGIIAGGMFRALSSLVQRMIDPNEYSIIAANSFASFTTVQKDLLLPSAILCFGVLGLIWRMRHRLDVLSLGRDAAVSLGINYRKEVLKILILIAVLVAIATALVGPVMFLGLLVVSITYTLVPNSKHAVLLPISAMISVITLIGGQTIMERALGLSTPLSVVIDLVGGLVFLLLIFRQVKT